MPATFPTDLLIDREASTMEPLDDLEIDYGSNGDPWGRSSWDALHYRFSLRLLNLTTTQQATLETFYATNRGLKINFTWPHNNLTYLVLMKGAPKPVKLFPGGRADFAVVLEG